MPAEPADELLSIAPVEVVSELFQGEMHDVMMMDLFWRKLVAQLEPDAVKQIDFILRQMGRMRAEIKHVLLTDRKVDTERQKRFRLRQAFPREASEPRLFGHR